MSRTERLLELLTRVRTREHFTVQEMADEFGVSRRTMLRDLQALSAMGVPLASSPGPGGGYMLPHPHRPITLTLTADEALGLILSYEATPRDAPSPFKTPSVAAVAKLRAALPPAVVREMDRLRERMAVVGLERRYEAPFLTDLLQAALDGVHLRIAYDSRHGPSERLIYPYGLVAGLGFWYCACYDYRRSAHAWLRADRVRFIERAPGMEKPLKLTLAEWLRRPVDDADMLPLRATLTPRGMTELDWGAVSDGLIALDGGGGRITMDIPAASLDFYTRLFLNLGAEVRVTSPVPLIASIRRAAISVVALYDGTSEG